GIPVARVPEAHVAAAGQLDQRRRDVGPAPGARVGEEPRSGASPRDREPLADVLRGVEISADVNADAAGPAPANLADHPGREAFPLTLREVAPVGAAQEEETSAQRVTLAP